MRSRFLPFAAAAKPNKRLAEGICYCLTVLAKKIAESALLAITIRMNDLLNLIGRLLIAILFLGGAVQKVADPSPVVLMINSLGLPDWLVWPIAALNLVGGLCLIFGPKVQTWALVLAAYCILTSWFHWQLRADPWQITIMVKNWSIAGGLCILAAQGPGRFFVSNRSRGR